MNIFKARTLSAAAVLMLCFALLMAGCQQDSQETQPTTAPNLNSDEAVYRVNVVDSLSNPFSKGIVVRFLRNGEQAAIQPINENGFAEKTLPKGDYTVELAFTSDDVSCYYDKEGLTLSADRTELTVTASHTVSGESRELYAQGAKHESWYVKEGCTYVTLEPDQRNYFLFAPTQAGTYAVSTVEDTVSVGYYGAPHFVQENSVVDVVDNTVTVSVSAGMIGSGETGTTILVLGVDANGSESCVLTVQRIGEPEYSISDEPWTEYPTTHTPQPFTLDLQAGEKLSYVNIMGSKDDYNVIYNESDGYYHMNSADGPIVYINFGKTAPNISLQVVIGGDGVMGGAPIRSYFFDDNGNFIRKEDYTNILMSYFACMDETYNVYPLTKDLVYILENGCSGWWDPNSPDYLFFGCTPELGWLFACCYITK